MSILADYRAIGTYDNSTGIITITSEINGFDTSTGSATAGNFGNDPEGVNFPLKVVFKDAVLNADNINTSLTDWERGEWSYSNTAGTITFERQTTERSSNGSAAVDFSGSEVEVFGAFSANQFPKLVQILQRPNVHYGTNLQTGITSQTAVSAADSYSVTPLSSTSLLKVSMSVNTRAIRTTSGGTARSEIGLQYNNSSGSNVPVRSHAVGMVNNPADPDQGTRIDVCIHATLDQSMLNPSGDWEILTYARAVDADVSVDVFNVDISVEEYLNP